MRPVQNRDIGNIIIAGILVTIVSQILTTFEAFLTMEIYLMEEFFPVWSRIMMSGAGPPPATFYLYSIGFSFIVGILNAAVFRVIEEGIPGTGIQKGLCYGFILFLISGLPFLLTTYLLINLPAQFFIAGTVFGFIGSILNGIIINVVVGR